MPAQRRSSGRRAGGAAPDPKTEITKLLRKGKKTWAESKEEAKTIGRVDVPDGTYEVDLQGCEFKVKDGTPYIVRRHVIVDGDHADKVLTDTLWFDVENAKRVAFIYQWLELAGFDLPEDPGELYEMIEQLNEECYSGKVRVYHWGDNNRMGVDLLEAYDPEDEDGEEGGEEEGTEEAGEEEAGTEEAGDDDGEEVALEDMTEEELLEVCKDEGIELPKARRGKKLTKAQLIRTIEAADEAADGGEEEGEEETGEEDAGDDVAERLAEFCKAQDIKLAKGEADDIEAMKKKVAKYEYVRDELEEDDVAVLTEAGLEELIVDGEEEAPEPEPKKTTRRRGKK